MKIFKTMGGIDDSNTVDIIDTIQYQGKLWLVPKWLDYPDLGVRKPARLIRIDSVPHQKLKPGSGYPADLLLSVPVPRSAVDGHSTQPGPAGEFEVVLMPDIAVPLPRKDRH